MGRAWRTGAGVTAVMVLLLLSSVGAGGLSPSSVRGSSAPRGSAGPVPTAPAVARGTPSVTAPAPLPREVALERSLRALGVPTPEVHFPDLAAEGPHPAGVVAPTYAQAPAPVGVADLGFRNVSGANVGYDYNTSSTRGTITFTNASSVYVDGDGADMFGVQFNTVLTDVSLFGNASYQFWTQNFISYTPSSGWLAFGDNIWNFSSYSGYFPASSLFAHGPNGSLAAPVFYYAVGPSFTIHYPFSVTFYNNATTIGGRSAVFFNYTLANATMTRSGSFDFVIFNSGGASAAPPPMFQVDGTGYDPAGLINDIELVLCGNDDGDTTSFYALNASLAIAYWNATSGSYDPVPAAVNFGADTGETVDGAAAFWNGVAPVAQARLGPSFYEGLWNNSAAPGARVLTATVSPANAFLFLTIGNFFNARTTQWVPSYLTTTQIVLPNVGSFVLEVELSNYDPSGHFIVMAVNASASITVTLTHDTGRGLYTPLYAWGNSQLAAISYAGNGTAADPYLLLDDETKALDAEFTAWNEFQFPVFSGVLLIRTSAYVEITPASFAVTYPAWMQGTVAAFGYPSSNNLQLLFWNVSNVSVLHGPDVSGWLSYELSYYPDAAVLFWNSSGNLVAGNTFEDEGTSLALFGGTNNTVWGNQFFPETPNASQPEDLLNPGNQTLAINESESGDLLYDNAIYTPIPAFDPVWNPLSCQVNCTPATYVDSWNISRQPASDVRVVLGTNLSGSILGTSYQGGNAWWNYGPEPNPFAKLPYDDTGNITVGGDWVPLTLTPLYALAFQAEGVPTGANWSVVTEGATLTGPSPTLATVSPDGTFSFLATAYLANGSGLLERQVFGSFQVDGAAVDVPVNFASWTVSFAPNGLPANTTWWLSVGPTGENATEFTANGTTSVALPLTNGSYSYTVAAPFGWVALPDAGSFGVQGSPETFDITFRSLAPVPAATYPVNFTESGLPNGTSWSVFFDGNGVIGAAATLGTFYVPNGSYTYGLGGVAGYTPAAPWGTFVVDGSGANLTVGFVANASLAPSPPENFTVTLQESGLAAGTRWSASVNGVPLTGTGSTLTIELPNGTFGYLVAPIDGEVASPSTGSARVAGAPVTVQIDFTPAPATSGTNATSGLPSLAWLAVGAVLGAVVAALLLWAAGRRGKPQPASPVAPPSTAAAAGAASAPRAGGTKTPWSEDPPT